MKAGLTVGELAKALQLNPRTIRYYEGIGLLPKPRRSASGYRLYSQQEMGRLRLIQRAKLLGLSLSEVKTLVNYAIDGQCNTLERQLLPLLERKLDEVDQRIRELANLKGELQGYCDGLRQRFASNKERESVCRCLE